MLPDMEKRSNERLISYVASNTKDHFFPTQKKYQTFLNVMQWHDHHGIIFDNDSERVGIGGNTGKFWYVKES